jgi:hypothetical protein
MLLTHIAARAKGKAKKRRMMNPCVCREKQETQHTGEKRLGEGGGWIEATIRDKKGTRDPPDWRPFQIASNQSEARRGGLKMQMALG